MIGHWSQEHPASAFINLYHVDFHAGLLMVLDYSYEHALKNKNKNKNKIIFALCRYYIENDINKNLDHAQVNQFSLWAK